MAQTEQTKRADPLELLLDRASTPLLRKLVKRLAGRRVYAMAPWDDRLSRRQIRRECLEFLKAHVTLDATQHAEAETEALFALWDELEPDLRELDTYGGGLEETETRVADLLYEVVQQLKTRRVPETARRRLLDAVLTYVKRGNAGMDDPLYEVADATCYASEDWRHLAGRLEALGKGGWPVEQAMQIYRRLGDHDKYLNLRVHRLQNPSDYHELASFYWERGMKDKALQVAQEGLKKTEGRKDALRAFLTKQAKRGGSPVVRLTSTQR
jgi:hypothetical protein